VERTHVYKYRTVGQQAQLHVNLVNTAFMLKFTLIEIQRDTRVVVGQGFLVMRLTQTGDAAANILKRVA
jgi:hypothetical protein